MSCLAGSIVHYSVFVLLLLFWSFGVKKLTPAKPWIIGAVAGVIFALVIHVAVLWHQRSPLFAIVFFSPLTGIFALLRHWFPPNECMTTGGLSPFALANIPYLGTLGGLFFRRQFIGVSLLVLLPMSLIWLFYGAGLVGH